MPVPNVDLHLNKSGFGRQQDVMTNFRILLDCWMRSARVARYRATYLYTHARLSFDVWSNSLTASNLRWALLSGSTAGIDSEVDCMTSNADPTLLADVLEIFLELYGIRGAARGRLTVWFDPPRISLDMFDTNNTTMFAEFIIDLEAEKVAQEQLFEILNNRNYGG